MVVDYDKLGELIDGYGGISADDLDDLPVVADPRAEEIALLIDESARLRRSLAEVELIMRGLRGGCSEFDGTWMIKRNVRKFGRQYERISLTQQLERNWRVLVLWRIRHDAP